ncbi:hypothetical protein ACIQFU_02050 [Streptomyces sp. NPDC093065]|uniref:hypothetical protein n=1 Tax=Streptomyces sp. NPDC093065 TaxID=3366021 RepID=UPI003819CE94
MKFAEQVGMSRASLSPRPQATRGRGIIYPDGRNWRLRPDFVFNGNGVAQGRAARSIPVGTPDPYAGARADLKVVDGGDQGQGSDGDQA